MKILVLNPPFLNKFSRTSRSPAVSKGGCVYYPIWLAYATGLLEQEGHEIKLIDAPSKGQSYEEVEKIASEFQPELIAIDTVIASFNNDAKTSEKLRKKFPKSFIVMVGTHPSALPEECLKRAKAIDAVARAEYDFILRDLAKALQEKKPLTTVKGITYRNTNSENEFISNPEMPLITPEELDEFPFVSEVYKKHLNVKDYFYPSVMYPQITIMTGRGCNYRCTFCMWPQTLTKRPYRPRSVENVVQEFEWIKKNFPEVKEIMIEDDTLTQDKERTIELCKELVKRKINLPWSCNSRADIDLETMQWMKKAKSRLMCVGFESGVQEILNNIKKGTKIEKIRQFMKDSKKAKILVHGCFMMGNKGETKESIQETVKFAKELDPDTAQFFPIMVYPGTEAFNWAKENNFLTTEDWSKWLLETGEHNTIVSTDKLSAEELVKECDKARRSFYMRPSYIAKKLWQGLTHPNELPRLMKSGKTFFKYLFNLS
ncbi:MAG: radical SAM protein [Candidatus Diapherotrites archaeon]